MLGLLACGSCRSPTDGGSAADPAAATEPAPTAEAAAATAATAADAATEPAPVAPQWAATAKGGFTVGWSPVGGPVPVNEPFEIDLQLFSDPERQQPVIGAAVRVTAWMPEHMHGMGRQSQTREVEPGRYRVKGMLLHMDGLWQLFVDVTAGGKAERAEFALTLE
jgi:hypothetical protein